MGPLCLFAAPRCFLSLPGLVGSSIAHGVSKRHRRGTESRHPERDGQRASVSIYSPQDTFTWLTSSSLTATLGGVDCPKKLTANRGSESGSSMPKVIDTMTGRARVSAQVL